VRYLHRLGIVLGTTAAVVTTAAAPALAAKESIKPGPGINTWLAILVFVGVPLALYFVLAALIWGPGIARRPRYRPGVREWEHEPVWVGGPDDPEAALARTPPDAGANVRGGGAGAGW
jgi:hypothetical protein